MRGFCSSGVIVFPLLILAASKNFLSMFSDAYPHLRKCLLYSTRLSVKYWSPCTLSEQFHLIRKHTEYGILLIACLECDVKACKYWCASVDFEYMSVTKYPFISLTVVSTNVNSRSSCLSLKLSFLVAHFCLDIG